MVRVFALQSLGGCGSGGGAVGLVIQVRHGRAAAAVRCRRVTRLARLVPLLLLLLLTAVGGVGLANHHSQPSPLPSLAGLLGAVLQVGVATGRPADLTFLLPIVVCCNITLTSDTMSSYVSSSHSSMLQHNAHI